MMKNRHRYRKLLDDYADVKIERLIGKFTAYLSLNHEHKRSLVGGFKHLSFSIIYGIILPN